MLKRPVLYNTTNLNCWAYCWASVANFKETVWEKENLLSVADSIQLFSWRKPKHRYHLTFFSLIWKISYESYSFFLFFMNVTKWWQYIHFSSYPKMMTLFKLLSDVKMFVNWLLIIWQNDAKKWLHLWKKSMSWGQ